MSASADTLLYFELSNFLKHAKHGFETKELITLEPPDTLIGKY